MNIRRRNKEDRSKVAAPDLLREIWEGVLQRPGRTVLTMIGIILGVAAVVSILGLTSTAAGQISRQFSKLDATEASAKYQGPPNALASFLSPTRQLVGLHGLLGAGVYWQLPNALEPVRVALSPEGSDQGLAVYAASPDLFDAIGARSTSGSVFNGFHEDTRQNVAVLGHVAAVDLGLSVVTDHSTLFINGTAYAVTGALAANPRLPQLDLAVIIPASTALATYGPPDEGSEAQIFLRTSLGAAPLVARQAPTALDPDHPWYFAAAAYPNPVSLSQGISRTVTELLLGLGAVAVVIGAFGIANTVLVSVIERTIEIGLRRALGAQRRHIVAQFLSESALIGLTGGLIGTALGVGVVVGTALERHWTAILAAGDVFPLPVAGALVGMVAGLYPAIRAARIEPSMALRR